MSIARPGAVLPLKVVTLYGGRGVLGTAADRSNRTHVREELQRVIASGDFDASRRSREFLRFIVDETLAGRGARLTQAAIASRVFGRREDFDPLVDPIVRIQAGRLRRSLERYYLLGGVGDTLRIELPRGTYVPLFRPLRESEPATAARAEETAASTARFGEWPAVAVGPFEPAAAGPEPQESAVRLMESLILELGRYPDVQAFLQSEMERHEPARRQGVRFSVGGRLRKEDGGLRVTARLVDHATGAQVWGEEYHTGARPDRWSGPLDDIGRAIAARVAAEDGVIVQRLARESSKRMLAPITPYRAILHSYDFFLARDRSRFSSALQALRQVVDEQPECGLAWSRLARLSLANHAFEVTPLSTPVDQAITYAQHGVRVDPSSRPAHIVLAAALLVKGELTAARHELEEALRLGSDSLVSLDAIGDLLTLVGDSERGPALVRTARERNPHCLPHASFGLWFDHLQRGELEAAQEEALGYRDTSFFWRAVMRASCLAPLGRRTDAESEVAEILRAKPDFATRGRVLIAHFIKRPDVMSRIVDGLATAGLRLA